MLGNFLETICWKIRVDTGSFSIDKTMVLGYGITLWFQGNGPWQLSLAMASGTHEAISAVQTFKERYDAIALLEGSEAI